MFILQYWWLIILVSFFVAAPIYAYHKVVEISSKYSLTTFLIAWPLRLIGSFITCAGLLLLSFIPVAIIAAIANTLIINQFHLSKHVGNLIINLEAILYVCFILNLTVGETVRNFIRETK